MQKLITLASHNLEELLEDFEYFDREPTLRRIEYILALFHWGGDTRCVSTALDDEPALLVVCDLRMEGSAVVIETEQHKIVIYDETRFGLLPDGVLYGFPECCQLWFEQRTHGDIANHEPTVMDGTGFIPCPVCRKRSVAELTDTINSNRRIHTTFPSEGYANELGLIAWLLKNKLPLGDNLQATYESIPSDFNYGRLFQ